MEGATKGGDFWPMGKRWSFKREGRELEVSKRDGWEKWEIEREKRGRNDSISEEGSLLYPFHASSDLAHVA